MKKTNHILAFILLSVYSCVFVHSIIPHSHNTIDNQENNLFSSNNSEENWFNFLEELVHEHENQDDNHDLYDEYKIESEDFDFSLNFENNLVLISTNSDIDFFFLPNTEIQSVDYSFSLKKRIPKSESLRGPPTVLV